MNIGQRIYNHIKSQFPKHTFIRIGFCPYNESMWDSMESVYDAAVADPECEATIIPLPFYSLDKNHKPWKISQHFTEHQKNFPHKLNVQDVIVIHNFYDDGNLVTRVSVYSDVLKAFCKKLVLIPYGYSNKGAEPQFVLHKGFLNADLIYCESAETATDIIRYLQPYCPNIAQKVFGYGSPKEDARNKSYMFPLEWIEKSKNRTRVLYNTSLQTYLNDRQKLDEIEAHIAEWELDTEPHLCVLWRPHPLLFDTMVAFHPEDISRYNSLVNRFINIPHCIFDDSPYFHRAMQFADICISDKSSVMGLFEGKLIKEG